MSEPPIYGDSLFPVDGTDRTVALRDDVTLSARVPADLRRRYIEVARRSGATLSDVVREALTAWVNTPGRNLGGLDHAPRSHRDGPDTEKQAAAHAWPRAGNKRRELLEVIRNAEPAGITSDEAVLAIGYSGQRRLHDLKAGGWVEPDVTTDDAGNMIPRRRKTRRGAWADVYRLTPAALERLKAEARR